MANTNIYDLADTWNDANTTYTSIKMDVTKTAANAASKLIDLQIGSATIFNVGQRGAIYANNTLASAEDDSALKLDVTWNTTANVQGVHINVTNTASGANSKPLNIDVGGSSIFNLNANGDGIFAGTLQFGTHSALAAETLSGYITITDAGGTSRKIGVIS